MHICGALVVYAEEQSLPYFVLMSKHVTIDRLHFVVHELICTQKTHSLIALVCTKCTQSGPFYFYYFYECVDTGLNV